MSASSQSDGSPESPHATATTGSPLSTREAYAAAPRPSYELISDWVGELDSRTSRESLLEAVTHVVSYFFDHHATLSAIAGASARITQLVESLSSSVRLADDSLAALVRSAWELLDTSEVQADSDDDFDDDDDAAYELDLQTLAVLRDAAALVLRIAHQDSTVVSNDTIAAKAARLHRRWAPAAAAPSILPRHHVGFVRAADSLLAMATFLRDYATLHYGDTGLGVEARDTIADVCARCCLPVILPLPAHAAVHRVGDTVVQVSLSNAAKGGDETAKGHLRRVLFASYKFDNLRRRAKEPRSQADRDAAVALNSIADGELNGLRDYYPFNGDAFEAVLSKGGDVAEVLRELRDAVIEAKRYALRLMGRPDASPDIISLAILVGAGLPQLEHFDIMTLFQLLMMLTCGLPVRTVRSVDPAAGETYDEVRRRVETLTTDSVRQPVRQSTGAPVSQYHSRLYMGMADALLRSSPRSVEGGPGEASERLRYLPASGDDETHVVGAGTLHSLYPQSLHFGAGGAPQFLGKDEHALRRMMAELYDGIADFDDVKALIMESPFPPRMVAFTTADLALVRARALASIDDSNATQNRLDAVLMRLGLYRALVRFLLLARARGHLLPRFSEGMQQAAGRALLALTSEAEANEVLKASTLDELVDNLPSGAAAVAAAFPASEGRASRCFEPAGATAAQFRLFGRGCQCTASTTSSLPVAGSEPSHSTT